MRIGYTFVIADMFHYGILQLLQAARQACDHLVCGLLTDEAVRAAKGDPISTYEERRAVLEAVRCVDEVIPQHTQDPTDAIRALRERFPDAEIIFVFGDQWKETPGGENLRAINVKTLRQAFYDRLGQERIVQKTVRSILPDNSVLETFTAGFAVKDFESFRGPEPHLVLSTKARTLQALKPLLTRFSIERTYVFTVEEWRNHRAAILEEIASRFAGGPVVVRSSCLNEDSARESKAGFFDSVLHVQPEDPAAAAEAVDQVVKAYARCSLLSNLDQVLVQRQTVDITLSGVLFTQDLETNGPYYVINYDASGRSDTVTSGQGGQLLKIFRGVDFAELDQPWRGLLEAVREVEDIAPDHPLDIEFAVTGQGRLVLFQARPLAANRRADPVSMRQVGETLRRTARALDRAREEAGYANGEGITYSDMIFWNPAELVGHRPANLAYALFDQVVMRKAWNQGIALLGYPNLYPARLMERVLYKPYINANLAFISTIPELVPEHLRPRLVSYFLAKLKANPHLHDKAEFEIMFTCYDFGLERRLEELDGHGFSREERTLLRDTLLDFTRRILVNAAVYRKRLAAEVDQLERCNARPLADVLAGIRTDRNLLALKRMLDQAEEQGAVPFAAAARCAFIADALLRTVHDADAVSREERDLVRNSFVTVASELTRDMHLAATGRLPLPAFLGRYGHLRAGTYDIEKPRYDAIPGRDWLTSAHEPAPHPELSPALRGRIDGFLAGTPLGLDFAGLYDFAQTFIAARERFKFVYTRTVSDSLEIIRAVAADRGLTAAEAGLLDLDTVYSLYSLSDSALADRVDKARADAERLRAVSLPPLLYSSMDLRLQSFPDSLPNFITAKAVQGSITLLDGTRTQDADLTGRIVFIENADPGYHWIFSRRIAGLVTKYGGAASHMAICCAEFGIPAAIGCGTTYDQLKVHPAVVLDCANRIIARRL